MNDSSTRQLLLSAKLFIPDEDDVPTLWEAWTKRPLLLPEGEAKSWQDVHRYWFGPGPRLLINYSAMFGATPAQDAQIRAAFATLWRRVGEGELTAEEEDPRACLCHMLLMDQLGRNMFRGTPDAYRYDGRAADLARRVARHIADGVEYHIEEAMMPAWVWLHSERLEDEHVAEQWLATLAERTRGTPHHIRIRLHHKGSLKHLAVVQRFGRFPHRNRILGRESTPEEVEHVANAEGWQLDQYPESQGGTWRYTWLASKYFVNMMIHFAGVGLMGDVNHETWRHVRRVVTRKHWQPG